MEDITLYFLRLSDDIVDITAFKSNNDKGDDDDGDEIELFKYELDGGEPENFTCQELKDFLELETSRKQVIIDQLKKLKNIEYEDKVKGTIL